MRFVLFHLEHWLRIRQIFPPDFSQTGRNTYNFRGNYPFLHDHDPLVVPADGLGECMLVGHFAIKIVILTRLFPLQAGQHSHLKST